MLLSQVNQLDRCIGKQIVQNRDKIQGQAMASKDITEIRAVLFDWELTLARVIGDVSSNERVAFLFQNEGLPFSHEEIVDAAEYIWQQKLLGKTKPQTPEDIMEQYRLILSHLGYKKITPSLMHRLYNGYAYLPTYLYDDTLVTLRILRQKGILLGIISNHTASVRQLIQSFVGDFINPQHIVISQEVGVHKPAKTIFQHALTRLGMASKYCLFVGDDLAVDAIGAVEKGEFCFGLWLDRNGKGTQHDLPQGVARITSLREVLNYI